jgi:subtilisin family serine protease
MRRGLASLALALALAVPAPAAAQSSGNPLAPASPVATAGEFVPGEVIVAFDPGADTATRADARQAVDGDVQQRLPVPGAQVLDLPEGASVLDAAKELRSQPGVKYAEPNWLYDLQSTTPNDSRYLGQWGLRTIDAPRAWDYTRGGASTVVAIIDSGYDYEHSDLNPNQWINEDEIAGNGRDDDSNGFVDDWRGWDFADNDADPMDELGHGSHVAGIVGARGNNGYGVAGVNWNSRLMNVKVCRMKCSLDDVARGVDYAARNGARVANISIGGQINSPLLQSAVNNNPGLLLVISAGNENRDNDAVPAYPCSYTNANIICVASTTSFDARSSFSNYGARSVDLGAPGSAIDSTEPFVEVLHDDFESSAGSWTSGGTGNKGWARSTNYAITSLTDSPGSCSSSALGGCYASGSNSWAQHSQANTSGLNTCFLDYRAGTVLNTGDRAFAELSRGGGTWSTIRTLSGVDETFPYYHERLSSTYDNQAEFWLRFRVQDNGDANVGDGAYFDDVQAQCKQHSNPFKELDGTSMAAPHVTGVAGLLFAMKPSATVAEVRNAILSSVDPVSSMSGVTTTGGRLNAVRALGKFDTVAPDTTIDAKPDPVIGSPWSAQFRFSSNEANATFECTVDGSDAAFTPCTSPATWSSLAHGQHTFRVRAKDPGGNYDPAPASYSFVVDRRAPETTIRSGPPAAMKPGVARLVFEGSETGSTFECKLDDATRWDRCSSPFDTPPLTAGPHKLEVRATDPVGNTDDTPAVWNWTVDDTAPTVAIDDGPSGTVNTAQVRIEFSSPDAAATFECSLDNEAPSPCTSPLDIAGLGDGSHSLSVWAVDAAGNRSAAAVREWEVRLPQPPPTQDPGPQQPADPGQPSAPQQPTSPEQPGSPQQPSAPQQPGGGQAETPVQPVVPRALYRSPKTLVSAIAKGLSGLKPAAIGELSYDYGAPAAGKLTLDIVLPGKKGKETRVGGGALTFAGKGRGTISVSLTRAGAKLLKRQRKAVLSVRGTWVPKQGRKIAAIKGTTLG